MQYYKIALTKEEFKKIENGNYLTWLEEYWENEQWLISQKETLTYDENGNNLTYSYEYWSDGVLDFAERDTTTYDENGKELSWKCRELVGDEWVERNRSTSYYNANGNLQTKIYEYFDMGQWINKDAVIRFSDARGVKYFYYPAYKIEISYLGAINVEEDRSIISKSIKIFPNPADDYIEITGVSDEIKIFDIMGREVWNGKVWDGERISVNDFNSGIYYVITESMQTKKLMIIR